MKNIIKMFCVISFFISNIVYADIKFWTTEVQPARMAKQEEMAKAFEAKTGIKVDVIPIEENSCHIGWNSLQKSKESEPLFNQSSNLDFYFNHSYGYPPDLCYSVYETTFKHKKFTSVIKKGKIVGLQFHPEKSQKLGLKFLKELIINLCSND